MLHPPTPAEARLLRDYFAGASYTHEHFQKNPTLRTLAVRLGTDPALLERTPELADLDFLLRWFFLGLTQTRADAELLAPRAVIETMLKCGVLTDDGDRLVPNVRLTPVDDRLFAADLSTRMTSEQSADLVIWPNPTTRLLQLFAVQRPSSATLDLGSGCGILGILAASQSRQVVASDLNPRAEEFGRFNAALNGVENMQCLTGDTFEPVEGRQFDLILANPPFFITPSSNDLYCENQMELDGYCRRVVREAPRFLKEGGFFQAVLEWVQVRGQTWQERLSEWLDGSGCDAWLLRNYVRDVGAYARERIRETGPDQDFGSRFHTWMEYYRQRGVEEIHGGILAMRRRAGKNWARMDGTPVEPSAPFGDLVLETFATQDILAGDPDDAALLEMKPRLARDAQLEQIYRAESGRWTPVSLSLTLTGVAPASSAVEPEVASFLSRCDGSRNLHQLADELAGVVKVDPVAVRRQCCAVIRTLAGRRILHLSN